MSDSVHVVAVLTAKPGMEARMWEQARGMAAASRAEDGCVAYDNYADPDDAAKIVVVEQWADKAAFDAHLASPHLAESLALSADLLAGPPSLRILREA